LAVVLAHLPQHLAVLAVLVEVVEVIFLEIQAEPQPQIKDMLEGQEPVTVLHTQTVAGVVALGK
jgi:hypothetical protein